MTRRRRAALTLAAVLLLAGCGESEEPVQSGDPVGDRPTWSEVEPEYVELLSAVVARLGRLAPDVAWEREPAVRTGESACDEGEPEDGLTRRNYGTGGGGAIPDADWGRVVEVVREVVEPAGFDRHAVIADEPSQHSISFYGPQGAELVVSGQRSTSIAMYGGCYVDPEAVREGR